MYVFVDALEKASCPFRVLRSSGKYEFAKIMFEIYALLWPFSEMYGYNQYKQIMSSVYATRTCIGHMYVFGRSYSFVLGQENH